MVQTLLAMKNVRDGVMVRVLSAVFLVALAFLLPLPVLAKVPETRAEINLSFAPVVKEAAPAVVNVYVRQKVNNRVQSPFLNDPFFRRFFGRQFGQRRMQNSLGSGVILRPNGIVVTNYHVIKGGEQGEIKVALQDKREFTAKIMLTDKDTDLAVLKIQAPKGEGFPFLKLKNSDGLHVGDLVLAIGNPFGVGQTVTSGIVSALARTRVGTSDFQSFIQTDAAINPGNSGGALVDMNGDLVGINTAIYSKSGGSNGIGFAIPSNMVRLVVKSAMKGRKVNRPWFGAKMQSLTPVLAEEFGLDRPVGALVNYIHEASPAQIAGLRRGDIILKVGKHSVDNPRTFQYRFATLELGGRARLTILRQGRELTKDVQLIAAPLTPAPNERLLRGVHPLSGARVANLSPALADELDSESIEGVIITDVAPGSYAARFGFRSRDVLVSINNTALLSVTQVVRQTEITPRLWRIEVKRGRRILRRVIPAR